MTHASSRSRKLITLSVGALLGNLATQHLAPAYEPLGRLVALPSDQTSSAPQQLPARGGEKVDYQRLARHLIRHPRNPVIKVGEEGTWDDQTLGCFSIIDSGAEFKCYFEGAKFGQAKQLGMAVSKDGIIWVPQERKLLFRGHMPHAIKVGESFRLYYSDEGELQLRTSLDAIHWREPRKVMKGLLDPCVIQVADHSFYLYYCDGGKKTIDGQSIWEFQNYLATSPDGVTWTKQWQPVLPLGPKGSWDSQSHAGPCVLKLPDGFHLWYLGSGPYRGKTAWRVGHATSPDGLKWTKSGEEPVLDVGQPGDWDSGTVLHFDAVFREKERRLLFWYAAAPTEHGDETKMTIQIGHGTSQSGVEGLTQ